MKKIIITLISIFLLCGCSITQYAQTSYNNVTVYGDDDEMIAYYQRVFVEDQNVEDSMVSVTFRTEGGIVCTVYGRSIIIETVRGYRPYYGTRYVYRVSRPYVLYHPGYYGRWRYTVPRYHHRPVPPPHHHKPIPPAHHKPSGPAHHSPAVAPRPNQGHNPNHNVGRPAQGHSSNHNMSRPPQNHNSNHNMTRPSGGHSSPRSMGQGSHSHSNGPARSGSSSSGRRR